ncbi:MAG: hypothetical protein LC733_12605 [Actinobacteria bacterium]|nr:hypothetical protein [Actinomycetota bacterium]
MGRTLAASAVLSVLALVLGACSDGPGPLAERESRFRIDPSFVGRLGDSDAFIGVGLAAGGAQIIAYVSDGDPEEAGRRGATSEWFVGGALGDDIDLTSRNGARLQVRIEGDVARGSVTFPGPGSAAGAGGISFEFSAERARGEEGGLYREEASVGPVSYLVGWVVLNNGDERGSSYPPVIRCNGVIPPAFERLFGRICP